MTPPRRHPDSSTSALACARLGGLLHELVYREAAAAHLLYEEQPARHRHVDGKVLARVQPLAEALHLEGRVGGGRGGGGGGVRGRGRVRGG